MSPRVPATIVVLGFLLGLLSAAAAGANWPALRGPGGSGVADEKKLPLRWSTNENVRWRVPLPDRGNSTPIIWGQRIFVTQAVEAENRRTLICFDRRDGKLLWQSGVTWNEKETTYPDNPPCTPSAVTDGRRVIAWFGSAGVYCYDFAGRELWHRDLGRQQQDWGYAASPILYRDLCLLNFGPGDRSFLIAMDKKSGRTVWHVNFPPLDSTINQEALGGPAPMTNRPLAKLSEIAGSWATPLVVRAGRRDEVVLTLPLRVAAYAARTGDLLWTCAGPNIGAYSSPFHGDGVVALAACGFRNTLLAVRPGGDGDVTASQRLWFLSRGNSQTCLGSGVIVAGRIYLLNNAGIAECIELSSGKTIWSERLRGTGARDSSWSSPVLAGERLYMSNRNADVFVLRPGPKFELLAVNSIGGENMNSSLAVADNELFIRTDKNLWCISNARPEK